jgi:hypothetical protein
VEERKKKLSSNLQKTATVGQGSNSSDAFAAGERKGLEPKWRKKIDGGYRIRFVMDSGAGKTIVPRDAIPGMKVRQSNGGSFRMANGSVIPNLGEGDVKGLGAVNSHPNQFSTQVADVTKPLAAATEAVDSGRTIILHRTGGIVKKLSLESEKKIRDIIKSEEGPEVILERRGGAFTFDIDVQTEGNQWEHPKKPAKRASNQSTKMDVDVAWQNRFGPLWEDEEDAIQCGQCNNGTGFHWP